jgi:hypothetical protein
LVGGFLPLFWLREMKNTSWHMHNVVNGSWHSHNSMFLYLRFISGLNFIWPLNHARYIITICKT